MGATLFVVAYNK